MLSYRHAFHAGNHADVLKHVICVELLRHLRQKDKPFWVIDTHAGAGRYALTSGYATQLAEYRDGIGRLWQRQDLPAPLQDYLQLVRASNGDGELRHYPGSPCLAQAMLRSQDRLRLFELHSKELRLLQDNFADAGRQVRIEAGDGFNGLRAILPPPPRRGLILIDPAYEDKNDYRRVLEALQDGLERFATGIYALWYPLLQRRESQSLPAKLKSLPIARWAHVTLRVRHVASGDFGMAGSGMFVVNPPWQLTRTLAEIMPYLVRSLAQDESAEYELEQHGDC